MVHEIDAHGVVAVRQERNLELRADAVSARDEHGLLKSRRLEPKQPAERADVRQHAGRERRSRECADAPHGLVAGVDVYTRAL